MELERSAGRLPVFTKKASESQVIYKSQILQLSSLKDGGDLPAFTTFTLSYFFLEHVICQCCVAEANVAVGSTCEQYIFFDPHDITQI